MNFSTTMLPLLILAIKQDPNFENATVTAAYENDIKPYPVTKPIVAMSVDKEVIGSRIVTVAENGERTLSKQRQIDLTFKVSIFAPYESGADTCFSMFENMSTMLMFNDAFNIVNGRCFDCKYVRDCNALQLDAEFTWRAYSNS